MTTPRRPVRIAGASGSASDRRHAITSLAAAHPSDPVDVIIGDWMSEFNMTQRGAAKSANPDSVTNFEPTFLEAVVPALPDIARHGIKVAVNAGASDTKGLVDVLNGIIKDQGLALKVAWISGDEVFPAIQKQLTSSSFTNIYTNEGLSAWPFKPIYAQAYLGGYGIAAALSAGADIVICGRVADASPIIGAAAWWHGWDREASLPQLANALVAGHLIECSTYVTGGNCTAFKALEHSPLGWTSLGFPIAEIAADGAVIVTKQKNTAGTVSVDTCTSQLLYEIQGPVYLNSDVAALLTNTSFEQLAPDRVALRGVQSDLPPPTTKVGITARGGYQAEAHWFLVGLDIPEKARMIEAQIRHMLAPHADRFSRLEFTLHGTPAADPVTQASATVDLRVLAQAPQEDDLAPQKFIKPCMDTVMQAYPGATPHIDVRQGFPKEVYEYFVTLLPQSEVVHQVHLPWDTTTSSTALTIPPPPVTKTYPGTHPGSPTTATPTALETFGPTVRGPLGWLVHARSGDKGSDCNVGFWVRRTDEYDWLRTILSVDTVRGLLGKENKGGSIDRLELPNLRAVHFLLHNHLDRGASINTTYDVLGKNAAEFLRARHVDLPLRFLERGKL